ncbi:LysR family transcriptional regulator ArgP [Pedomonas mirosovicensis]|uniref:LysR family transcriptional regulator ArgP n=1 Tax=Pedomonas mirosovicensis TaxID=2908641 RepID=UPI00216A7333|nr:LysR family transcriptional regulator ArgP [Pedomonas mirosovicensis]MCH8685013.1 LysR family transcriptional regulator ArgP [Pedomonas mirosovicensis]
MLDYASLEAVAAVVQTGSFEKAARQLGITPSAVSQRVKLLEERLGAVVIVRGQPCTATPLGTRLCRHVESVGLLEHGLQADLGGLLPGRRPATLRIAVNADSLATWFIDAMAATDGLLFDLVLDDQDHSADWLRRGEVSAAVTAHAEAVQGCSSRPLGAMRFLATASPAFMQRWFANGIDDTALAQAPCLCFNAKDALQARWIASATGQTIAPPTHWLPSSHAFVDAALAGLGWGMNPEPLARPHLTAGRLVELQPGTALDVPLFWQWSRAIEDALAPMTTAVLTAASRHLAQ